MPGKKKKSSSSKKNKSSSRKNNGASNNGNRKKAIQLEDVLTQAESAMEMSDVNTALQLFSYAAGVLHTRVHDDSTTSTTAAAADNISNNINQDKSTLSTVLGKMGELKASNGDVDGARSDFLNAIELLGPSATSTRTSNSNINTDIQTAQNCESRANLHLYLGQLSMGIEALDSLKVGVTELEFAVGILERICCAKIEERDDDVDMEDVNVKLFLVETRRQLCAAHCSIAELYLTDLCEEPDAESLCESSLKSALALDEASSSISIGKSEENDEISPPPPDALQTMANFRLSQSRVQEALECILKAYDRMKVGCEAMSTLVGLGNNNNNNGKAESASSEIELEEDTKARELVNVDAASSLPEYNFRVQTAKILLECASSLVEDSNSSDAMIMKINQCAESAIQVLGSLMAENDEIIEVWYLLGCAFVTCTPANIDSATYYWKHAHEMLIKVKGGLEEAIDDGDDDEAENELEAIECQIKEVETKLEKYSAGGDSEGDEEMKDS